MSDGKTFAKLLGDYSKKLRQDVHIWHRRTTEAALKSIQFGSEITGAPGQPVKKNVLRPAWRHDVNPDGTGRVYVPADSPAAVYAPFIEDGVHPVWGPLTLRSSVGGFHSVKLTKAGLGALAYYEAMKLRFGK